MALITLYRQIGGVLTDATTVTLSDPANAFGIMRLDNQLAVVAAGTAVTHVSTGVYQYDVSALDPRYVYVASWKIVSAYGTEYWAEAINEPGGSTTRGTIRWEAASICGLALARGTATGGTTLTLIDDGTSADGILASSLDASERFQGAYCLMTSGTAANIGHWRQISDDAPSTGTITLSRAFPSTVTAGDTYEIYGTLRPDQWSLATDNIVDVGLQRCQYVSRSPITLVPDGDMEANGIVDWTGTNCTLVKTVSEPVTDGAQALLYIASGANGYAQSDTIPVTPNLGFQLWVDYRCVSSTLSTAVVQVWDVTNNALIEQAQDTDAGVNFQGGMMHVGFSVPDNCYGIAIRLGALEATAVVAFDDAVLVCNAQFRYTLPSWLTTREQYATLQERWGVRPLDYRWTDVPWPLNVEEDPTAVVTFRCDLPPNNIARPVYLLGERPYGPMASTADSATSAIPLEWARLAVADAAMERYGHEIEQSTVARHRVDRGDVAARLQAATAIYKPTRNARVGFTKPWLGTVISRLP